MHRDIYCTHINNQPKCTNYFASQRQNISLPFFLALVFIFYCFYDKSLYFHLMKRNTYSSSSPSLPAAFIKSSLQSIMDTSNSNNSKLTFISSAVLWRDHAPTFRQPLVTRWTPPVYGHHTRQYHRTARCIISQSSSSPTPPQSTSSSTTEASSSPSSLSTDSSRVQFPSLTADMFRHPVDIRATRMLRALTAWAEPTIRFLLRRVEDSFFFENLTTGVRVTSTQYGTIHKQLVEACQILDISPLPEVYVRQNAVPNAYTLAFQGNRQENNPPCCIVLHSSLVDLLTTDEIQAVLAHELGHVKSEHGVWITMANLLLLLPMMSESFGAQLLVWQRAAELSCDRAMLLVTQDTNVAMSTLMKLTGGSRKFAHEMDVEQFLQQADTFDQMAKSSWLARQLRESMIRSTTHPLPILRVRELKRWSQSNQFRSLLTSGKMLD